MKTFARWFLLPLGISLAFAATAAKDPNEKAIKSRQAVMTLQSWYAGPLFGMAKGDIEYNAEMAKTYAEHLSIMASVEGGAMWPEGTDNVAYAGKTRALPEAWTNWEEAGKKAQALSEATAALAAVAGDGLDALRSNIGPVGKACKGCHDDFRAEQK